MRGICTSLLNLADVYRLNGLIDKSLFFCNSCLDYKGEILNTNIYPSILTTIAQIYFLKGDFKTALSFLLDSKPFFFALKDPLLIVDDLVKIIQIKQLLNLSVEEEYVELQKYRDQNIGNNIIKFICQLGEFYYHLSLKRLSSFVKAKDILIELRSSDILINEFVLIVNKELAKILILELQTLESKELWSRLDLLLDEIENLTLSNNMYPDLV